MAKEEGRGEGRDKDPDEVTADSEHAAAQCRLRGVDLAWGLDLVRVVRVVTRWPCGMPHGYVGASIWSLPICVNVAKCALVPSGRWAGHDRCRRCRLTLILPSRRGVCGCGAEIPCMVADLATAHSVRSHLERNNRRGVHHPVLQKRLSPLNRGVGGLPASPENRAEQSEADHRNACL